MDPTAAHEIDHVIELFRQGQLTEPCLRQSLERLRPPVRRQDLLYLQATSTALTSSLLGLTLVRNGEFVDQPASDWPYSSVLGAICDGWRVIKFPELALLLVEERTISLGCEFILEKWS